MSADSVAEGWFTNTLSSAKRGDRAAFDELVSWLETPMLAFLRARGVGHVDHVANAALVRVFRGLDGFRGDAAQFRAWTFRVLIDLIGDHDGRAGGAEARLTAVESHPDRRGPDTVDDVDVEPVDGIEGQLSLLTPDQRDVLLLRALAGLSVDETAAAVRRRPGQVGALQRRALATLRGSVSRTAPQATVSPAVETRWSRSRRDEIDAVLGDGVLDIDLVDVAGIVYDLRLAFLSARHVTRHRALLGFTEVPLADHVEPLVTAASDANTPRSLPAGLSNRTTAQAGRRRSIRAWTAVTAGVAGKLAFGAAVAAASVGGLHVADVVDVPGLPDVDEATDFVQTEATHDDEDADKNDTDENDIDENEVVGNEVEAAAAADLVADEKREFSISMRAWTRCVAEAAAAHGEANTGRDVELQGAPEPFDPEAAPCGPRPRNPNADSDVPGGRPEDVPGGRPEDVPGGRPEDVPGGRPEDVPGGRPEDVPGDRPEDVPVGRSEDVPRGRPEK
jgi:RNA polymerase sigma-70 factor (ECF subfamily)